MNGFTNVSLGVRSRSTYLDFLRDVEKTYRIRIVILCAFSLGKSAIGTLAESIRLKLPPKISNKSNDLDNEVLGALAKGYPIKCKELHIALVIVLIAIQTSQIQELHSQNLRKHNKTN